MSICVSLDRSTLVERVQKVKSVKRFDPITFVPLTLIPVLLCLLLDLARVDAMQAPPEFISKMPAGSFADLSVYGSDLLEPPNVMTMEDYVPLALLVLAPFGLGVLSARRTPGIAFLLLIASTLISFHLLNLEDHHWIPALFPAVIIASAYAGFACLDQWAYTKKPTHDQMATAETGLRVDS
jgi:hypothetical protein